MTEIVRFKVTDYDRSNEVFTTFIFKSEFTTADNLSWHEISQSAASN